MRPAGQLIAVLFLTIMSVTTALADSVSSLAATHRDGQTFVTWTVPPGEGWTYRIYASPRRLESQADLAAATWMGTVGDSTWYDRRLSRITRQTHAYAIDSLAAPLAATQGLFVATPVRSGAQFYAVTAVAAGDSEDRTLIVGDNSLAAPVAEQLAAPRPVFQRTIRSYGNFIDIYTLWTSHRATSTFPAMSNRSSRAFDCGIVRGRDGSKSSLMIRPHPYGQNFLLVADGSGEPGEWRLTLDDPLETDEQHTWWYGYHEGYGLESEDDALSPTGVVQDYTLRRMEYTVEWALRTFPIDRSRVYASGFSMGGIGSLRLAMKRPDLIAAVHAVVPKFDFSDLDDPDPRNLWTPNASFRRRTDRLWGSVSDNLPTSDGMHVYERLDMKAMAARLEGPGMPPVIAFSGKQDHIVGWAEKIDYYKAMDRHRHGGTFYWDTRTHTSEGAWSAMENIRDVYRYRNGESFPAFSRCSANDDPGDGNASSGDSVGTLNAYLDWDAAPNESRLSWEATLRLRDLDSAHGPLRAPDRLQVDVTPRRLQRFKVARPYVYTYHVMRLDDGVVVQSGEVRPDAHGLITLPQVEVGRWGSRVILRRSGIDPVVPVETSEQPTIELATGAPSGPEVVTVIWPAPGDATLELYDVTGRQIASVFRGRVKTGRRSYRLDTSGLPSGMYFLAARQDGRTTARKVAIAR